METLLEFPGTEVAMDVPLAPPAESLVSQAGNTTEITPAVGAAVTDFSACYARELSSLVWFVMSLGADAHRATLAGMPAEAVHVAALSPLGMPNEGMPNEGMPAE